MGKTKRYRGQRYRLTGAEPYENRWGKTVMLEIWESSCADCGAPFQIRISARAKKFVPNRRCPKCKEPGLPVEVTRAWKRDAEIKQLVG